MQAPTEVSLHVVNRRRCIQSGEQPPQPFHLVGPESRLRPLSKKSHGPLCRKLLIAICGFVASYTTLGKLGPRGFISFALADIERVLEARWLY